MRDTLTGGSCLALDAAGMACRGPSCDSCWSQLLLPPLNNSCTLLVPSSLLLLSQPELIGFQAGLDQLHDQVLNCNRSDRRSRAICSAEPDIGQSADPGKMTPAMATPRLHHSWAQGPMTGLASHKHLIIHRRTTHRQHGQVLLFSSHCLRQSPAHANGR